MKTITITSESAGKRLDKFLTEEFFSLSRGEIARQIKAGKVRVNGVCAKPSYLLQQNDSIEAGIAEQAELLLADFDLDIPVVFENADFMIIDKPAGVQVHPSSKRDAGTLANWIAAHRPEIINIHDATAEGELRPGIVHRLDRETSGLLIIAKNQRVFDEFKRMFKNREISKTYVAVVKGVLVNKEGLIEARIARSADYRRQTIATGRSKTKIREALTEYRVVREDESVSLVELKPRTGRMHQLRIHMKHIGHPIVGDKIYGDAKFEIVSTRQLLHAKSLEFDLFGHKFSFDSKLPPDLLFRRFVSAEMDTT